jgi:hypothetical protein
MIKVKFKKHLNENLLLEMPHLFKDDLPKEFLERLPDEVRSAVDDMEALDFAFERYPKIDSLKGTLTKYPKKFYVILQDKKFLVDDTGMTTVTEVDMDEEQEDVLTLPHNWYEAFLERIK